MFSLGIEFSLHEAVPRRPDGRLRGHRAVQPADVARLRRPGRPSAGRGWQSFYAGAAISISSTTIIVKAFEEQRIKGDFTHIVFGILIVEDLIAILLDHDSHDALRGDATLRSAGIGETAGRLTAFWLLLIVVGLLTVPRLMRLVVRLDRPETTVVASVGLAFGFAHLLASTFGYSVALGAFLAGSLVAESGVAKTGRAPGATGPRYFRRHLLRLGRHVDRPAARLPRTGRSCSCFSRSSSSATCSPSRSARFSPGESVQTSVKTGMSLAQIGEFSFIIAGVGMATRARPTNRPSIAVFDRRGRVRHHDAAHALADPRRRADRRRGSIASCRARCKRSSPSTARGWKTCSASSADEHTNRTFGNCIRWLVVDAVVVAAIVIGASLELGTIGDWAQRQFQLSPNWSTAWPSWRRPQSSPRRSGSDWCGCRRVLGFELASRVFPTAKREQLDLAAAPRRLLVVTLQLAIVLLVGMPLVAITQPFVPTLRGRRCCCSCSRVGDSRSGETPTNLQGHTRAAAQAIVRGDRPADAQGPGHGSRPARSPQQARRRESHHHGPRLAGADRAASRAAGRGGKTLAEIKLRGLTGATCWPSSAEGESVVVPAGSERLQAGDVLAVAGTHTAVEAAEGAVDGANDIEWLVEARPSPSMSTIGLAVARPWPADTLCQFLLSSPRSPLPCGPRPLRSMVLGDP